MNLHPSFYHDTFQIHSGRYKKFKKVSWLCMRRPDRPLASRFIIAVLSVFMALLNDPTKSSVVIKQCPLISILSSLPISAYRIVKTLILNFMKPIILKKKVLLFKTRYKRDIPIWIACSSQRPHNNPLAQNFFFILAHRVCKM
jgi:hypothetical protein